MKRLLVVLCLVFAAFGGAAIGTSMRKLILVPIAVAALTLAWLPMQGGHAFAAVNCTYTTTAISCVGGSGSQGGGSGGQQSLTFDGTTYTSSGAGGHGGGGNGYGGGGGSSYTSTLSTNPVVISGTGQGGSGSGGGSGFHCSDPGSGPICTGTP